MSLLPITLGVKRSLDAKGGGVKKRKPLPRKELVKLVETALQKDAFTCRYCGFQSSQFQRAFPKDWAVSDPRDSEMVTGCIFCEQCFNLENVGAMGSGTLVWLPEISQADLHHIMRAIYACRAQVNEAPENIKNSADRAFEILFARRGEAKRRIGTDDPMVLAAALLESVNDKVYAARSEKLEGVRLLPLDKRMAPGSSGDTDQFPKIIMYWVSKEGPFGKIPVTKWNDMLKKISNLKDRLQ